MRGRVGRLSNANNVLVVLNLHLMEHKVSYVCVPGFVVHNLFVGGAFVQWFPRGQ